MNNYTSKDILFCVNEKIWVKDFNKHGYFTWTNKTIRQVTMKYAYNFKTKKISEKVIYHFQDGTNTLQDYVMFQPNILEILHEMAEINFNYLEYKQIANYFNISNRQARKIIHHYYEIIKLTNNTIKNEFIYYD